jgi:microcystin-dependent protein
MATPYIGEIRLFSFVFPPKGWALCDGQLLPINQNQALFSILGTTYGGNGQTNFALPNLQGRMPAHASASSTLVLGEMGGEERHTLIANELPAHTHAAQAVSARGTTPDPAGAVWAGTAAPHYAAGAQTVMSSQAVAAVGGSQSHDNMPPYLVMSFCISLLGIFPSRS